jgi:formylglycine-generating enzyme required for sulfatase activity
VPGFYIDRYEVTNAEYAEFVAATNRPPPSLWHGTTPPIGREKNPVADIRYEDAEAYALWKGKKLPTREQWMRAFRGDNDRLFPWGDEYDSSRANVGDNKEFPYTSPVTQTPQDVTATNVFNMMGNVAEYVRGVMHHEGKSWRVLKGGCYNRPGFRYGVGSSQLIQPLDGTAENAGFRCVVEVPTRGAAPNTGR